MDRNFGKLLSEHKTSLLWLLCRKAAFYTPALIFLWIGIDELIQGNPLDEMIITMFIIAAILILLSLIYAKSFKAAIYEKGFVYSSGLKKAVELSFSDMKDIDWWSEVEGEDWWDAVLLSRIFGYVVRSLFVGFSPAIGGVEIHKKDGSTIKLKTSRDKKYRQFVEELQSTFAQQKASPELRTSRKAKRSRHSNK